MHMRQELRLDHAAKLLKEAYVYLQSCRKAAKTPNGDGPSCVYDDSDKIWLLQQTLLLSSRRTDEEVIECLSVSLALSPPLNGWWFKTFMLPGDAVPISMSTPELLKHGFQIYKPLFVSEVKYIVSLQECRYEKLIEALKLIPFEWQDSEGYVGVSERGLKVLHVTLFEERKREAEKHIKNFMHNNKVFLEHLSQNENEISQKIDDRDYGILRDVWKMIKKDFHKNPIQRGLRGIMIKGYVARGTSPSSHEVQRLLEEKWPEKTPIVKNVVDYEHSTIFTLCGTFCHICNRQHSSNGQYVTWTDNKFAIYINYKCHDNNEKRILLASSASQTKSEEIFGILQQEREGR